MNAFIGRVGRGAGKAGRIVALAAKLALKLFLFSIAWGLAAVLALDSLALILMPDGHLVGLVKWVTDSEPPDVSLVRMLALLSGLIAGCFTVAFGKAINETWQAARRKPAAT